MKKTYYVVRGTRISLATGKPIGYVVYAGRKSSGEFCTGFGGQIWAAHLFRTREAAQEVIDSGVLCKTLGEGCRAIGFRYSTVKRTFEV